MSSNLHENLSEDDIINHIAPLVSREHIDGLNIEGKKVILVLKASPEQGTEMESWRQNVERLLLQHPKITTAQIILTMPNTGNARPKPKQIDNLLPHVKNIIAVASGKGGVGKSTVASNIAVALAAEGLKVGLMDADIYGPSMPILFGLSGQPPFNDNQQLIPPEKFGVKLMSMGLLVEGDSPMIWRGPMIQTALVQFMRDVEWGELDCLIVDMPPGTGDAQLTMAQKVPLTGAIIVSTPQDIALIDARKAMNMFRKTNVPIFGLVENMSYHICDNCGHESHIFGHGGAEQESCKSDVDFLGAIPLAPAIRSLSDAGTPIALETTGENAAHGQIYRDIAQKVITSLKNKKQTAQIKA